MRPASGFRQRFTDAWSSRIGREAATAMWSGFVWDTRGRLSVVVLVPSIALGWAGVVNDITVGIGLTISALWFLFLMICLNKAKDIRATVRTLAARHLNFDGDPRAIPLRNLALFDRWCAAVGRSGNAGSP